MHYPYVDGYARSRPVQGMKPLSLPGQLEYCAGSLFGIKSCVCRFALAFDREYACSLPSSFHATTRSWRFQHKRTTRTFRLSNPLEHRPTRKTAHFFITRQRERDAVAGNYLQLVKCAQHLNCQSAVSFHVEDTRPIDAIVFLSPRPLTN